MEQKVQREEAKKKKKTQRDRGERRKRRPGTKKVCQVQQSSVAIYIAG